MAEPIMTAQFDALLAEFTRSGLRELHVRSGETEIYLSNDPSATPAPVRYRPAAPDPVAAPVAAAPPVAAPPPPAPPPAAVTPGAIIVRAPNLGTFYGAPKPGAAAYVSVGSTVTAGAELCLIEVMKLFTAVRADVDGRIDAILASDGDMVEAGQPLFAIVAN